jgi:predicted DNA-binding protein (MmcQ/YjbR family)
MNKAHWVTILLDGTADDERLKFLLRQSFELTKSRKRK